MAKPVKLNGYNSSPTVGDRRSCRLAERLRLEAKRLSKADSDNIAHHLSQTVFISHTSADDGFITGGDGGQKYSHGSIWWIAGEKFSDPFYHSMKTGGATSYVRIVGSALASARRVLIVWSQNALKSDFVRAEVLIATGGGKKVGVFLMQDAPPFPVPGVEQVRDYEALNEMLESWK